MDAVVVKQHFSKFEDCTETRATRSSIVHNVSMRLCDLTLKLLRLAYVPCVQAPRLLLEGIVSFDEKVGPHRVHVINGTTPVPL